MLDFSLEHSRFEVTQRPDSSAYHRYPFAYRFPPNPLVDHRHPVPWNVSSSTVTLARFEDWSPLVSISLRGLSDLSTRFPTPALAMVPVTRVHDPCLVALFKQLPPADQMTARKVCRRWEDLVTYAARSTRSLAILVGENSMKSFAETVNIDSLGSEKVVSLLQKEDGSPMFPLARFSKWNALQYHQGLDKATVEAIVDTFVNLNTLQIGFYYASITQLDFIAYLLELWSHQLTSLKVLYPFDGEKDSADRLFGAINRLSTLKQLQLGLGDLPYHDLPIISKLEQLQVYWAGCSPLQFVVMLQDHVKVNSPLRCVKYLHHDTDDAIKQFTKLDDHLLARFTRFEPGWRSFTNSELICTKFRYLTSVNIQSTTTTLRRLFGHLSQLTQLLYLRLDMNFRSLLSDDQPHLLLPQLKSVKALKLDLTITSHSQLEQLKIGWTMPNLQAIDLCHIWPFKCTDCTIEEFSGNHIQANLATFKRCYRQMLAPLKRTCTQIRAILHNHEDILGTAEELLAEPPVLRIVDWMKRRSTGGYVGDSHSPCSLFPTSSNNPNKKLASLLSSDVCSFITKFEI